MILKKLGIDPAKVEEQETLTVPRALVEMLLRMLIVGAPFNEQDYLARNPDVREAVKSGKLRSGHQHFLSVGYLEGRHGGCPVVDENWYINAYADVARSVAQGKLASGTDHYIASGAAEWRSPSEQATAAIAAWRSVLTRPKPVPDAKPVGHKPRRKTPPNAAAAD